MSSPLPPEREGSTRQRRAGEGLSASGLSDKAYEHLPTQRSRELRNNGTPAERKLWAALCNRKLCGMRFNRQVVIKPYICDFVARSRKLAIEIDGVVIKIEEALQQPPPAGAVGVESAQPTAGGPVLIGKNKPSPSSLRSSSPPAPAGGAK